MAKSKLAHKYRVISIHFSIDIVNRRRIKTRLIFR